MLELLFDKILQHLFESVKGFLENMFEFFVGATGGRGNFRFRLEGAAGFVIE